MLSNWVSAGGNLIAMRPARGSPALLGIAALGRAAAETPT